MRQLFVFTVLLVPVLVLAHDPHHKPMPTDTTAVIATWNINSHLSGKRPRISHYARGIRDMDPELIVLTEVNPDSVAGDIVAELNGLGACYLRVLLEQTTTPNIASCTNAVLASQNQSSFRAPRPPASADRRLLQPSFGLGTSIFCSWVFT